MTKYLDTTDHDRDIVRDFVKPAREYITNSLHTDGISPEPVHEANACDRVGQFLQAAARISLRLRSLNISEEDVVADFKEWKRSRYEDRGGR